MSTLSKTNSSNDVRDNNDDSFNDAIQYPNIKGIKQIVMFADVNQGDNAIIDGITITYDGVADPVSHGLVPSGNRVGTYNLDPTNERLVGVFGQWKNNPERIGSLSFVKFNTDTGEARMAGPFQGSAAGLAGAWGGFGDIFAFKGTTNDTGLVTFSVVTK